MGRPTEKEVTDQIRSVYDHLEKELQDHHPGVVELLRLYGEYEQAADISNAYLEATSPSGSCGFTDTTSA